MQRKLKYFGSLLIVFSMPSATAGPLRTFFIFKWPKMKMSLTRVGDSHFQLKRFQKSQWVKINQSLINVQVIYFGDRLTHQNVYKVAIPVRSESLLCVHTVVYNNHPLLLCSLIHSSLWSRWFPLWSALSYHDCILVFSMVMKCGSISKAIKAWHVRRSAVTEQDPLEFYMWLNLCLYINITFNKGYFLILHSTKTCVYGKPTVLPSMWMLLVPSQTINTTGKFWTKLVWIWFMHEWQQKDQLVLMFYQCILPVLAQNVILLKEMYLASW